MMRRTSMLLAAIALFGFTATACEKQSGSEKNEDQAANAEGGTQAQKKEESKPKTVHLESVGNEFKYDKTKIEAKPGQKLTVTLKNNAEKGVKHNFVLLNTNDDKIAKKVASAGLKAPDNDHIPKGDVADNIVAHSGLAASKKTVEVTFKAPKEPGKYKYICTFPGHYPQMQGTLVVEK